MIENQISHKLCTCSHLDLALHGPDFGREMAMDKTCLCDGNLQDRRWHAGVSRIITGVQQMSLSLITQHHHNLCEITRSVQDILQGRQ